MDTTKDEATAHKHNNQSSFLLTAHCQFQTTKLSIYVPALVTSTLYNMVGDDNGIGLLAAAACHHYHDHNTLMSRLENDVKKYVN